MFLPPFLKDVFTFALMYDIITDVQKACAFLIELDDATSPGFSPWGLGFLARLRTVIGGTILKSRRQTLGSFPVTLQKQG